MSFPFSQEIIKDGMIRTFHEDVDSEELKWHFDLNERFVVCEHETDWLVQFDNQLPQKIKKGEVIHIPPHVYHRVIKGTGDLIVKIKEVVN